MNSIKRYRYAPRLLFVMIALAALAALTPTLAAQAVQRPAALAADAQTAFSGAQQTTSVKIYMIALDDNGRNGKRIGCGDSVVPVRISIHPTNAPLRAALNQLFAVQTDTYAGRYNALFRSTLSAGPITISRGRATIPLYGEFSLGGVCDDPRVTAQIEETALQFANVTSVAVTINGVPLRTAVQ